jgi:hypothetical protein
MNLYGLKLLLNKNRKPLLFIVMGMIALFLGFGYITGDAKISLNEVPAGLSSKRAYFFELLIYKLGGLPLVIGFYLLAGIVCTTIGILEFKKRP